MAMLARNRERLQALETELPGSKAYVCDIGDLDAACGAIMVTGNTAAFRGIPNYAVFSPTKAAQRNLTQCLARDLGPKGVHVTYFNIDAVIDVEIPPFAEKW